MNIKNIEELKREKLRLKYEMELAELELKASLDRLSNQAKPAHIVDSVLTMMPFKNAGVIAAVATFAVKLFTKNK